MAAWSLRRCECSSTDDCTSSDNLIGRRHAQQGARGCCHASPFIQRHQAANLPVFDGQSSLQLTLVLRLTQQVRRTLRCREGGGGCARVAVAHALDNESGYLTGERAAAAARRTCSSCFTVSSNCTSFWARACSSKACCCSAASSSPTRTRACAASDSKACSAFAWRVCNASADAAAAAAASRRSSASTSPLRKRRA